MIVAKMTETRAFALEYDGTVDTLHSIVATLPGWRAVVESEDPFVLTVYLERVPRPGTDPASSPFRRVPVSRGDWVVMFPHDVAPWTGSRKDLDAMGWAEVSA